MTITVRKAGNVAILDLVGPLKMGDAEMAFRERVDELINAGTRQLAINLAGVPEMDSSGIGALVRVFSAVKTAGGKCKLFGAPKRVRQTLKMVRLDNVLELVEDEAAALADLA
ncbi:MAG: STAS domain-containing protein [Candidatus Acidiferrales bacterium]